MKFAPLTALPAACLLLSTGGAAEVRGDAPDAKPLEAAEQLERFKAPPGFEVQLVASEPQIQKPMNITFDAAGRLWVTGSELYPFPARTDALGRPIPGFDKVWQDTLNAFRVGSSQVTPADAGRDSVRILSELDENGTARRVQIFAEGLNIPTGVQPYRDGAIVFSIPNVWRLRDTDGDGRADTREVLYGSFGFEDTHGMSASYLYWIDGWIYGTHGFRNSSEVRDGSGQVTRMHSGNTYRFRPDGSLFEIYTHGQTNPFGLTVDARGNFYSADSHSKPVYLLLRGGFYPGIYKQHDGLGFAPAITDDDHGSSAIAGIAWYEAEQFPEEYRGNVFIGNPVTRRINRDRFEWKGSTPKAVRMPDFLTCDDPWFRPVQVKLGPDGALYIADFYNPIIGHYEVPLTDPRRDRTRGRIWRVVWRGENKAPAPALPDLSKLDAAGLVEEFGDANLLVRTLATNELVDRIGRDALEPLWEIVKPERFVQAPRASGDMRPVWKGASPVQRAHALLALRRLTPEKFPSADHNLFSLARVWEDDLPRALLLKMLATGPERWFEPDFENVASALSSEGAPAIKRASWEAVARAPHGFALDQLLDWLPGKDGDDPLLQYAVKVGLRDYLKNPRAMEDLRELGPAAPDAVDFVCDVLVAVPGAGSAEFILKHLDASRLNSPRAGEFLRHVALHVPPERLGALAAPVDSMKSAPLAQRLSIAAGLAQAGRQRGLALPRELAAWTRHVALEGLGSPHENVVKRAIEAVREFEDDEKLEPLSKIVVGTGRPSQLRTAALEAVANLDRGSEVLSSALSDTSNMALRKRAAELLGQRCGTGFQRFQPVGRANRAHPTGEDACATLLAALPAAPWELAVTIAASLVKNETGAAALLRTIESGKASSSLLRNKVVGMALAQTASRAPGLEARAAALTAALPPEDSRLDAVIAQRVKMYQGSRSNAARGGEVFQQHCAVCHRFRESGGSIGPNLDGIAARGVQRLAEDIFDPNRNVDPAFHQALIETLDGVTLAGGNVRTEGELLLFNDAAGKEVSVPKARVKTQSASRLSLMPPNYEQTLSNPDFADLMAFLLSAPSP
ncbi:MAG: c-type cytochrome [Verrucomicrobiota bacterium]|nr:c-type cytochrome [Verrucomicrobiota bacterium]